MRPRGTAGEKLRHSDRCNGGGFRTTGIGPMLASHFVFNSAKASNACTSPSSMARCARARNSDMLNSR
ncbi:UNVERIFIED_CONTAM: hypothetical protein Slati_0168300 [Sesamum latifolium]|uniref:Uncharacterized protein n=1 Tax=Sesamum latifolium TaxID=2727402 RepID=A0AAW2YAG9_9LAMI